MSLTLTPTLTLTLTLTGVPVHVAQEAASLVAGHQELDVAAGNLRGNLRCFGHSTGCRQLHLGLGVSGQG